MNLTKNNPHTLPRTYRFAAILLALLATCYASQSILTAQSEDEHEEEESNLIHFTDEQIEDFRITVEKAGAAELSVETLLPGEIKLNQENMAHVSPRYDGIVTKISARLGNKVKAGQVLATLESNETLAAFNVSSPIDGTIVDFHITLGESVEAGRYLYIVADLESVWVDLDIFQKDIRRIEKGQKVLINTGHNSPNTEGIIDYVGPVVNEDTRTGLARMTLPNAEGKWKAGMFITGHVTTDTRIVPVAVKRSALQVLDGQTVVFVKIPKGFEPRPVTLGRRDTQYSEVLSGIQAGELYASERSFVVKAQKEKAEIDPEAGHNH
jgi:cobalt-zinc-cadmium efflux system membrane fusion protein